MEAFEAIPANEGDYEMDYLFSELAEAPPAAACRRCGLVALDGGSRVNGELVCSDCADEAVFPV